jgi:hypothetical protein
MICCPTSPRHVLAICALVALSFCSAVAERLDLSATPGSPVEMSSANYCIEPLRNMENPRNSFCAGLVESLVYLASGSIACPPSTGITRTQIHNVVVAYIEQRPARLQENFKDSVLAALGAAWPCSLGK